MKSRHRTFRARALALGGSLLLAAAFFLAPLGPSAFASSNAMVVIVSAKTAIRELSSADLRRCFLGQAVEVGGVRLVPFNQPPDADARKRFDRRILNMSLIASQRFWIDNMIRGGVRPPRTVPDPRLLVKVVASLKGAVSYTEERFVPASGDVTFVAIDGVAYDDPSYPLR